MIQLLSVSKRYEDGYYGLRDVTFKVEAGQFVFLTGESGAGKSTVLRMIYRAERPTSGTVLVDGIDTAAAHGNSLRALVKILDGLSDEEIVGVNIPTGVPLVYKFDKEWNVKEKYYLGDAAAIKDKIDSVAAQGKA